jgi:hypothetical protein
MTNHPVTVGELITLLQGFDPALPVQMSMNMEYQGRVRSDYLQVEEPYGGGDPYLLITDCPSADWNEDPETDGQPDEAQEWHDFDPDC